MFNTLVLAPNAVSGEVDVFPTVNLTVFVNVKNEMTIAQDEIFTPVLSVIAYDSEDEAVQIANDSENGLHAAVIGTGLQRARRVASPLQAGRVVISGMTDDPQALPDSRTILES